MRSSILLFTFVLLTIAATYCQKKPGVEILTSGTNTSLRGMSIPLEQVIWVSGSNGTIGKSVDAGKTWRWMIVAGFEKKDFRDIEAFDSSTAIIMAIDNPAYILKTTDGGASWKKVFERAAEGMFLDAMDFKNEKEGICIGDPLNHGPTNKRPFYVIRTFDGGNTWSETPTDQVPLAQTGEALFSASGTNISFLNHPDFEYAFVTGGMVANVYMIGRHGKLNRFIRVPIVQGKESAGTDKLKKFYCVGGDYKMPDSSSHNYYYTTNMGNKWRSPSLSSPFGYRSCIRIIENKTLVACGTTGVDFASNAQKQWKNVSPESFNVCMVSKGKQVFLAGEKGKIGKALFFRQLP